MPWYLWIPLGLVAGGLVAEALARHWIRRHATWNVWPPGLRHRLHLATRELPELDPVVRFDVNRDGERGDEPPAAGESAYRVLLAGGSAPECYLLDQDRSLSGAIQAALGEPASLAALGRRHAHAGSVARSRVGSVGLDRILEEILPRYRALDAIVIMVGATDLVEWLEVGAPEDWTPPELKASGAFSQHGATRFGWSPKRTGLFEVARRLRLRWLTPLEVRADVGQSIGQLRRMRAAAQRILPAVPSPDVMLGRFERHFRSALRRAKGAAPLVLVVEQPCFLRDDYTPEDLRRFWIGGVGNARVQAVDTYFALGVVGQLMETVNRLAARIADEEDVPHMELMSRLPRTSETFYDFMHFTPGGAAAAAAEIAARITSLAGDAAKRQDARPSQRA